MRLNKKTIEKIEPRAAELTSLPEKVLQFGTGVFLRAFVDYFIDQANRKSQFNGRVVMVASTKSGRVDSINSQDGLYTVLVQGIEKGETIDNTVIISSVSRAIAASDQWEEVLDIARSEDLELVISNTTEVGLQYDPEDRDYFNPPKSFPGKLALVLKARAEKFNYDQTKGLLIIPCELLDQNGERLKSILTKLMDDWRWEDDLKHWILEANTFCNSLVDRIVPGSCPSPESLGYSDELAISAEPYRLWAIDSDRGRLAELGLADADHGIIVCDDIEPYRLRKVRLLNGIHTAMVPVAILAGHTLVRDAMHDPEINDFVEKMLYDEILPTVNVEGAREFSDEVLDRFRNPFIDHELIRIMLHATMKMRVRVVPSILRYREIFGAAPEGLSRGLLSYLKFKRGSGDRNIDGVEIRDEPPDKMGPRVKALLDEGGIDGVLSSQELWGEDLSFLSKMAKD